MFGTIGTQELIFIFLLALVLFGPKKLPEIGRTVGKALREFRRASSELKATFDRELSNLEAETKEFKEIGTSIQQEPHNYNYDYSSYESSYEGSYPPEEHDSQVATTTTVSVSAPQDAESTPAVTPEGVIAQGSELSVLEAGAGGALEPSAAEPVPDPHPVSVPTLAAERNA
ncbi:MAG TPA: twin-arginine translocase TatA/TatE family subunit [Bryobacteraceae bacterium]|nr:twin-arginine translocase TatA/TatE family subunit [Bryobacteraceae bacterium]